MFTLDQNNWSSSISHQIRLRRVSTPDPAGGAHSASPDLLAGFKGPISKGRGRTGGGTRERRVERGRRGQGKRKGRGEGGSRREERRGEERWKGCTLLNGGLEVWLHPDAPLCPRRYWRQSAITLIIA